MRRWSGPRGLVTAPSGAVDHRYSLRPSFCAQIRSEFTDPASKGDRFRRTRLAEERGGRSGGWVPTESAEPAVPTGPAELAVDAIDEIDAMNAIDDSGRVPESRPTALTSTGGQLLDWRTRLRIRPAAVVALVIM